MSIDGAGAAVAVAFPRLGPYHLARLRAAHQRFAREGVEIVAIETAATDSTYAWSVESDSQPFRRITLFPGQSLDGLTRKKARNALVALFERERFAAYASSGWSFPESQAVLPVAARKNVPLMVMSETAERDAPRRWWREWLKRRVVRRFRAGLVGGRGHIEYLAKLGVPKERIFRGYDCVDNDYFFKKVQEIRSRAERERISLGLARPFFLTVCRFVAEKNLAFLLKAFARSRRQLGEAAWDLVLCGDGPLRGELERMASSLGVAEAVHFPGFVQYPDLPRYYALAGGFVLASQVEPWGLVVNEAMASGVPSLVSDRCGCAEELIVEGQTGHTFSPRDEEALVQNMRRLATDARHRDKLVAAAESRIDDYGPRQFAEGLWNAFIACRRASAS